MSFLFIKVGIVTALVTDQLGASRFLDTLRMCSVLYGRDRLASHVTRKLIKSSSSSCSALLTSLALDSCILGY